MKLYTKTGDKGDTGLFGGQRVPKTDPRIHAYGTIDELNALLGVVLSYGLDTEEHELLVRIQGELMVLASHLATPYNPVDGAPHTLPAFEEAWITSMEEAIDKMDGELPTLQNFILPGGSPQGAQLHVARTVCRRAERALVALTNSEEIDLGLLQYLNRLSDLLFVLARYVNHSAGAAEQSWNTN